jgi:hypothetical protein
MPRTIEYLSPTSIALFEQDQELFYQQYISDNRPVREPQNRVMSIGSAFDARAKSYLHQSLFGATHTDSNKFLFQTIFEAQVEKQNRDWALENSKYVFEQYKQSGALGDLMLELQSSSGEPKLEFDVRGAVSGYREAEQKKIDEVVLLGKPDVSYISKGGAHVILDFKVSGYCSSYNTSPAPGYVRLRGAGRTNYGSHKDCFEIDFKGVKINCSTTLDVIKKDWAAQCTIYSWLCGAAIGEEFIVCIDQLVCNPNKGGLPSIKVAEHKMKVNPVFQRKLFNRICEINEIVRSNWFFRDMEKADSIERCRLLDGTSAGVIETPADEWFQKVTEKKRY